MITALLAMTVTGATYTVDWKSDALDLHLTGMVDTAADSITWDALPPELETTLTWPALTAGEVIRPSGEYRRHELVTYDIPDDWSGEISDWAFISEAFYFYEDSQMRGHTYWGLGGNLWTSGCDRDQVPYYNCPLGQWLYPSGDIHDLASAQASLVEVQLTPEPSGQLLAMIAVAILLVRSRRK